MAWITSNPIHNTFAALGVRNHDSFTVNEDCLAILEEILRKLVSEDCTLRTFRRAIGFGQNIRKDLIPLLVHVKAKRNICDATKIIDTTIKILLNLSIPVEYLLPMDEMSSTDVGKHTIFELNRVLTSCKEVFVECRTTKAIVDHMKYIVEKDSQLDPEQCDSINNCLLLLRNVLHVPETKLNNSSMQNQIIWNLFTQNFDKIVIYLMSCPQKIYWSVTMVQLIALMYKDQHVGNLQKLLNLWLEASFSESSEDNESNTSPPDQELSGDSSPIITSDPTSDSSDNSCSDRKNANRKALLETMKRNKSTETETSRSSGISSLGQSIDSISSDNSAPNLKMECPSLHSEISDCGYGTQVENQESISTSSNDDDQPHEKPVHQKPHIFQKSRYNSTKVRATTTALEKKELRRKRLVKRSKTHIIKMKGLVHHLPTDEDIANILKEFTVDFLLKGYGSLVHDLHLQLLTNIHMQIDTSHFFWLVTYFLKFATQLELDLDHISPVLSYKILSYLVFQGVLVYEELELLKKIEQVDLKPCLRRLHLVVTAIREFLQAVEIYKNMIHLSDADRSNLNTLQAQISATEDLRSLFILLLGQFNPKMQSLQYLQDLIITNHSFLLFLDHAARSTGTVQFNIMDHLKQFATVEMMRQYGHLLEHFKENGEFINNCIFTMMHHIGGDLKHLPALFQPSILKTFSQIWETDYEICDDWSDLIEYVIHKFINTPRSAHCSSLSIAKSNKAECSESSFTDIEWTKEEKANLLSYYNQSRDSQDTIANITKKYQESGTRNKTQISIIRELLEQNIINQNQYNDFMRIKHPNEALLEEPSDDETPNEPIIMEPTLITEENLQDGDIKVLKEYLHKENKGKYLIWLQSLLLESCFVKLFLNNPQDFTKSSAIMEPSVYSFASLNLPIPVVPWTVDQNQVLKHQPFILLLHKLGFYLPVDTGKVFVRIPNFWNAEYVFSIAQQLGPIDTSKLKFDIELIKGSKAQTVINCAIEDFGSEKFSNNDFKETPSIVRYTPLPNSTLNTEWFRSKVAALRISTNELSIVIPTETEHIPIPPPELCLAKQVRMDCSPISEHSVLNDDNDSITASIASDLTRMCVSDEEDKVIVILRDKQN